MRVLPYLRIGATLGLGMTLSAQSPPPANISHAATGARVAASEPAPSPSPSASIEPPSLIPPNILPGPGAGALPQMPMVPELQQLNEIFKQSSLGRVADESRLHLQTAQLEIRIRNDAELHAARASAQQARTDLEKRHQLKAYYHLYYNKLRALAETPDLKAYLDLQETVHTTILLQPKTRHESDEATAVAARTQIQEEAATTALPTPAQARAEGAIVNP